MKTHIIPEDRWISFFEDFSREHTGWPATIDVLDDEAGPQHVAVNLPLLGISFDTKGTRPCSIEITAGNGPNRQVTHVVDMPLHIREAQEPGGPIDLQIEPATGPKTLIRITGPVQ